MLRLRAAALGCAFVAMTPGLCAAESPRTVTMADVLAYQQPVVRNLAFDGETLLAVYGAPGEPSRLVRWRSGRRETLAPGTMGSVSPDGRWLLYLTGDGWVLLDQRDASQRRLTTRSAASAYFGVPVWSKDSRFVAAHFDLRRDAPPPTAPVAVGSVHIVEGGDPPDVAARKRALPLNPQLLIWDVTAAQPTLTPIDETEGFTGAWGLHEGRPAYYYAVAQHAFGGATPYTAVRELEPLTRQSREVVRFANYNQGERPKLSPDGGALALALDVDTPVYGVANSVVIVTLADGRWKSLATRHAVSELQWAADGWIYFTARQGGLKQLARIDLQGREEALSHDARDRQNLTLSASRQVLAYTTSDGYGHADVRRLALPTGQETIVETLAEPERRYRLGHFEAVRWTAPDGVTLNGFLIQPPDFDPKRRYPVYVDVHGSGPGASLGLHSLFGWKAQTPLEWHVWASLGYVVFVPDYRSSGEYGATVNLARVQAADGDKNGIAQDARDVEAGVRWLLTKPYIDPSRIALFGHSAGGGRVNYLLTRSNLFAAGIVHEPVPSGPDAENLRLATLGLPAVWSRETTAPSQQRALGASFLFDGWRSTTPTLIMVGNPDMGAGDPLSAEMLCSMLLAAHVPTHFIRYLDDGHIPNSNDSALHRFNAIKAWLDLYLKSPRP